MGLTMIPLQTNQAILKTNQGEVFTTSIEGIYTLVKPDNTRVRLLDDEVMELIESNLRENLL